MPSSLRHRLLLFCLLAIFFFVSAAAGREWFRRTEVRTRIQTLEKEIASLEQSNEGLEMFLQQLNDEAVVERQARERLNLKKPGENVVVLLPAGEPHPISEKPEEIKSPPPRLLANALSWWGYFFEENRKRDVELRVP